MFARTRIIDRYLLRQILGTLGAVVAIVMSLMVLEHLPRLIDLTRFSGHRGYIVVQTVIGLLPEYAGIGLLVGLYLAIALTVRRLTLRGELDAIEASGVGPWRWMRMPLLLAVTVSALTFLNQGWLMPAGEAKLNEIGHRMAIGDFGYNLQAGEFVDLGSDSFLIFQKVEPESRYLEGIFLRNEEQAYTAAKARLSITPAGVAVVELFDGQVVREEDGKALEFKRLRFLTSKPGVAAEEDQKAPDPLRLKSLNVLLASGLTHQLAAVYGRALWGVLPLLLPFIAFVLGKPPNRGMGSLGIFVGLALLVLFLKTIALLTDGQVARPETLALTILLGWMATTSGLLLAEKSIGRGFLDRWCTRLIGKNRPRLPQAR